MNTKLLKIGGSVLALALALPAYAADTTLPAKNASGTTVQLKVQDDAGTLTPAHTVRCSANPAVDCVAQPQAVAGSDASTAISVQGITGGKAVPVSGTFWQTTQPVSLAAGSNIAGKVGIDQTTDGTTNLVAAKQNGTWNVTNISGTVSLPTGAATAAKQPALGTAGTPSADVITVQGVSGGTNLNVNCAAGCGSGTSYTEDAAAAADPVGIAIISRRRDTMSTSEVSADGDNIGLISTNKGELRINDSSLNTALGTTADSAWASGAGSAISLLKTIATASLDTTAAAVNVTQVAGATIAQGNGTAATAIRVALPTDGTGVVGLNAGTNLVGKVGIDQTTVGTTNAVSIGQIGANTVLTGNGVTGTGSIRVTVASDNSAIPTNVSQINGVAPTMGNGVSGTGVQRVTIASDSTGQVALATGSNTIGATYGFAGTATTTITRPADTTAYAANDALSDSTSAPTTGGFTLSSMCRASGGSGILTDMAVVYSGNTAVTASVYLYDSAPTAQNDNAAWSVSDSDQLKLVGIVPFTLTADGANGVANVQNLNMGYTCSGSANLRFMVKVGAAFTPASADTLTIRAKFVQTN